MIPTKEHIVSKISSVLRLSFSLAKVNFKLRNEGSYLGFLWYLLNPLALFFVLLFVKGQVFLQIDVPYYPIYLMIGLLMFHFSTSLLSASIGVISSSGNFIKSIKIPSEALVISRVLQSVFSHFFELILILACLLYFNVSLYGLLVYLVVFASLTIFLLGVSFVFATLGVYVNDLNNIWAVVSQVLFFITPIFHIPVVDSLLYKINLFNPLYYFMSLGREMFVYGRLPSLALFAGVMLISFCSFFIGLYIFEKKKDRFAELV